MRTAGNSTEPIAYVDDEPAGWVAVEPHDVVISGDTVTKRYRSWDRDEPDRE